MPLAQSFHLLATLVFVLVSAVVGARLVQLARHTRQQPELLLGSAILGTAVLGYGVLIAAAILRGNDLSAASATPTTIALSAIGQTLHAAGVTCFLLFILRVFHPRDGWAHALGGVAGLLLWGGLAWSAWRGAFVVNDSGSAAWWCEYAVIWTYPLWIGIESLRYWRIMRRRVALGLGDPLVANRFALWGFGSIGSAGAIWTASIPFFLLGHPDLLASLTPPIHVVTAIAGLTSVGCSYLAFLPPPWYARRIEAAANAA